MDFIKTSFYIVSSFINIGLSIVSVITVALQHSHLKSVVHASLLVRGTFVLPIFKTKEQMYIQETSPTRKLKSEPLFLTVKQSLRV